MAFDASINKRAKEICNLKDINLGEAYESRNDEEIRKLLILQLIIIERFHKMSVRSKEKIMKELDGFSNITDSELIGEMNKCVETLKDAFKSNYEVLNYMLPEDKTIYAVVKNRKELQTESFFIKLEDDDGFDSYLQELIKKFQEEGQKKTTNNKYISSLKKKISICQQIQKKEQKK